MPKVAGVDCSTQSTKVVVCDADSGEVLAEGSAAHPEGTEVDPNAWWSAFEEASHGLLEDVTAIGVGGQQHGLVALDDSNQAVRPALLWNDTRSAAAAERLVGELGGPGEWAQAVGSVPVASFTVTKLRWMAECEPDLAERVATVMLPHDWITWRLSAGGAGPSTDRGDASGTGYWSPTTGEYRLDLLERAFGRSVRVPRVLPPAQSAGQTGEGALVSAGTGDNMGAALGLGAGPGDVVVSIGTSGTAFAVHDVPTSDATGEVAGFADATGRFLPLVCTLNAARVLTATARLLDTDLAGVDRLAAESGPGAEGLVLLPYLDGERTPNLPDACGTLTGLRRTNMGQANVARAAVEGMLCGLADGVEALRGQGVRVRRVLLVGGGARSSAVRSIAPTVFGVSVTVPPPAEYVALGAARQASWALAGRPHPPEWEPPGESVEFGAVDAVAGERIRARYADARGNIHGGYA
ncbi:MAG: xylulokinase [Nocardioidaceae bacterium]